MRDLRGRWNHDFTDLQHRTGIVKESWQLLQAPRGDVLIAYVESDDVPEALRLLSQGESPFEQWFKRELREITGASLAGSFARPNAEQLASDEADQAGAGKHPHV